MKRRLSDKGFEEGWITAGAADEAHRQEDSRDRLGACRTRLRRAAQSGRPLGERLSSATTASAGLLMYGIPNMKLEKSIVDRRINLMAEEGVRFITNTAVGVDYAVERLRAEFDAIVVCAGATQARDLCEEGRDLGGIHFAMDFLRVNTKSLLDSGYLNKGQISAEGKDVIVIGGGDTGTDCVGTSIRHGCRSLVQFEILAQPPEHRAFDNPWPQWPKIYRMDYGQEEAAARWGSDPRRYSILTKRFVGDHKGQVKEVHTIDIEWVSANGNGRMVPREIPGTERVWPAQLVLLALGFLGPERGSLFDQLGVTINERGNVAANAEMMTNVPGVFAAGDASRGQSLVVWAIADGRHAARGVDKYLMGETSLP
ncbi:MAG: FAD-dependent oxidoreductase [Pyrinomonadaceae bacterium]